MENHRAKVFTIYLTKQKNGWHIGFRFPYDEASIPVMKSLGYRWNPQERLWHKPYHRGFNNECEILTERSIALVWDKWSLEIYHSEHFKNQFRQKWSRQPFQKESHLATEIASYRDYLRQARYSGNTISSYVSIIGFFLQFTEVEPNELTMAHVEDFNLKFILEGGRSVTYQRQFTSALKLFVRHIIPESSINPDELDRPKRSFKLPKVLSEEEVWQMINCTANLKHRLILSMLYACGLRVSELCNLRTAQLDFDRKSLTILNGKGRVDRQLPLGVSLNHLLKNYMRSYQPKEYLFSGQSGLKYSQTSVRKIVKSALKRAGIRKHATPHTLRHSFATHLLENGTEMRYIQEFLGHRSVKTTMIYAHVRSEAVTKIINPLDRIISNQMQKGTVINSTFKPSKRAE